MNKNIIYEILILTKTYIILPVFVIVLLCVFLSSGQFICYSVHKSCCDLGQTLVLQALVKHSWHTWPATCTVLRSLITLQLSAVYVKLHCEQSHIL